MVKPDNQHNSEGLGGTVFEFPQGKPRKAPEPEPQTITPPLDLMKHIPECSFKHYAADIARMCSIHESTTLLIGLGIVSAVASRTHCVMYPNGDQLPLGEYIVCGQPPGAAKSRLLKAFQRPIFDAEKQGRKAYQERKKAAEAAGNAKDFDEPAPISIFLTDATPEGIDKKLGSTGGFFSVASAEQAAVNSLIGASYGGEGRKNNNDLPLKGFNYEFHNSARADRGGYCGGVTGSITCFAQEGTIETILGKSEGTGLAERFLMLAEPNQLGKRDHTKPYYPNQEPQNIYNRIMGELTGKALSTPESLEQMPGYRLSPESWMKIYQFRNEVEPHMLDGGKYSTLTMRGAASKVDIHIMKIAALLAILNGKPAGEIDQAYVEAGINIMRDMLTYINGLLSDMGITGVNAFEDSVIEYLSKKGQATRRQIDQAKRKTKPWAEVTPKKAIGGTLAETIDGLILKGIVGESEEFDSVGNSRGRLLRLVA